MAFPSPCPPPFFLLFPFLGILTPAIPAHTLARSTGAPVYVDWAPAHQHRLDAPCWPGSALPLRPRPRRRSDNRIECLKTEELRRLRFRFAGGEYADSGRAAAQENVRNTLHRHRMASKRRSAVVGDEGDSKTGERAIDGHTGSDTGDKGVAKRARVDAAPAASTSGASGDTQRAGAGAGASGGAGGSVPADAGAGAAAGGGSDSDSDSSDGFGPQLPGAGGDAAGKTKPPKRLRHEKVYLDNLPRAAMYEKSYMHRDRVSHCVVAPVTEFILTASTDGHLKFWKKMSKGIEFVKHYRAHLGPVADLSVSSDGQRAATVCVEDKAIKFYDVEAFDMVHLVTLGFEPTRVCWLHRRGSSEPLVAVAAKDSNDVYIFNADNATAEPLATVSVHAAPVVALAYNEAMRSVVSADAKGTLHCWSAEAPFGAPTGTKYRYKMDTDLFELAKKKSQPRSLAVSPNGRKFVVASHDSQIRVFDWASGKLKRQYDESPAVFEAASKQGTLKMDSIDFGKRMAVERELLGNNTAPPSNAIFDETGHFILFPTMLGIKVINIVTNKLVRVLGRIETTERFLALSLYQGTPKGDSQFERAGKTRSMADDAGKGKETDPTLVCASFKRNRLYLITKREPDDEDPDGRDVFNEAPSKEERLVAADAGGTQVLGRSAVIHTSLGDVHVKLYPDECPRTVENFSVHSQRGYYDNVIFHRVIKGFMVQTGDPKGDGTGGESIWGGEFEDEIVRSLRHDRPFTLSMANAGPNTNGSQFFITTAPTPWLDNKHTVFGRVTKGTDVVEAIERTRTDDTDKPLEDIKIISITIHV